MPTNYKLAFAERPAAADLAAVADQLEQFPTTGEPQKTNRPTTYLNAATFAQRLKKWSVSGSNR